MTDHLGRYVAGRERVYGRDPDLTPTIMNLTAVTSLTEELGHTRRGSERETEILLEIDRAVTAGVAALMGYAR